MADKTTTGLTGATLPLDGTELHYVVQGGNSRKVAGSEVVKIAHNQAWTTITGTPTTLSGYGITDAATSTQGGKADTALQSADIGVSVQAHGATLDSLEGLSLVSGDVLYATAADTLARLAKGSDGQVLKLASGVPSWGTVAGTGDVVGPASSTDDHIALFGDTTGKVIKDSGMKISDIGTGDMLAANDLSDLSSIPTARKNMAVAPYVADRTALKALDTAKDTSAYLKEAGREGQFGWDSSDLSAKVTVDTAEGIYIAPTSDATGASGAWVRSAFDGVTFNALWFGVVVEDTTKKTSNQNAFNVIHSLVDGTGTITMPLGLVYIDSTIAITKKISWKGASKLASGLYAVGFGNDTPILDYQGTTDARIQNISIRNMSFWSDNKLPRAVNLTWVNKSSFEDLYMYQVRRGFFGDHAWSNSFKNISRYEVTDEMVYFGDECNNCHFDRMEFGGSTGFRVVGNCAGLSFSQCDIEDGTDENGYGILIAPTTGKRVIGVTIIGNYFEKLKGPAIGVAGADARSVLGVVIKGNSIYGGSADYFSSAGGVATNAIVALNCAGVDISENTFNDWLTNAIYRDNTFVDGNVKNNQLIRCPALSNTSNVFSSSVEVRNNYDITNGVYIGRRVEMLDAVPTAGHYTAGDLVINRGAAAIDANSMGVLSWSRMTTGTAHVVGTDWRRNYVSNNSPVT